MAEISVFALPEEDLEYYQKQVKQVMRHCLKPGFKSLLVLAPHWSGKTHYAQKGLWHNGIDIVTWPSPENEVKVYDMNGVDQADLGFIQLREIERYLLRNPGSVVAYSPNATGLRTWLEECSEESGQIGIVLWMPRSKKHATNFNSRPMRDFEHSFWNDRPTGAAIDIVRDDFLLSVGHVKCMRPYTHDDLRGYTNLVQHYIKNWRRRRYWEKTCSLLSRRSNQRCFKPMGVICPRGAYLVYCADGSVSYCYYDKCCGDLVKPFVGLPCP